jgi:hypothetical protein
MGTECNRISEQQEQPARKESRDKGEPPRRIFTRGRKQVAENVADARNPAIKKQQPAGGAAD